MAASLALRTVLDVVLVLLVATVMVVGQQSSIINIATSCNGHCAGTFGQVNNSTCPKLQGKLIVKPFNCMNATCGASFTISADSQHLNFSIFSNGDMCNAQCGDVFVPFDVMDHLRTSICCGFAPSEIKARTAVDYICSELYDKSW